MKAVGIGDASGESVFLDDMKEKCKNGNEL